MKATYGVGYLMEKTAEVLSRFIQIREARRESSLTETPGRIEYVRLGMMKSCRYFGGAGDRPSRRVDPCWILILNH